MNFIDFLTMGGQERRRMLDNYVDDLNLERFLPPNLRPAGQFVNEMNPVNAMGNAMQDASVVFDPDATAEARKRAAVDMGVEMAMSLAPAALVRAGYLAAPAGLAETFALPVGVDQLATDALSDLKYAARSVRDGDMQGLIDVLTPSRDPQSVGAAVVDDDIKDFELDVGDAAFEYQPYLPTLEPKPPVGFFSPSLRAAENLKQNKGTYDQMRGMLLKGGAKKDELEWSGADAAFAGKKVTKQDLINYLKENDPRPVIRQRKSRGGLTGSVGKPEDVDFDTFFDEVVAADRPFVSQLTDERHQSLVDDIEYDLIERGDVKRFEDLSDDEIMDIAESEGHDIDEWDADDFDAFYQDLDPLYVKRGDGGWTGVDSEWEAVEEYYTRDTLEEEALQSHYEQLKDEFDYDPEGTLDRYGYDYASASDFDAGDTSFAGYFPSGGDSYTENLFQFRDPTGELAPENAPYASHFGADDETTMFTTRTADFRKEDDNALVDYTGEIQSDFAQKRPNTPRDRIVAAQEFQGKYNSLFEQREKIKDMQRRLGADRARAFRDASDDPRLFERLKWMTALDAHNTNAKYMRAGQDADTLAKLDADMVYVIDKDVNDLTPDEKMMLLKNDDISIGAMADFLYANPEVARSDPRLFNINEATTSLLDYEGRLSDNLAAIQQVDRETETNYGINAAMGNRPDRVAMAGGPYMSNSAAWPKYAIKQSILDAIDRGADYVAFPKDEEAIGAVGGTSSPAQGTIDRYQKNTVNYIKDVMKPFEGHYDLENVRLSQQGLENEYLGDRDFDSLGIKLTPNLVGRINDKGFSTFAALGAIPIMGVIDYMREKQENRNQRLGGLMGYGGL